MADDAGQTMLDCSLAVRPHCGPKSYPPLRAKALCLSQEGICFFPLRGETRSLLFCEGTTLFPSDEGDGRRPGVGSMVPQSVRTGRDSC